MLLLLYLLTLGVGLVLLFIKKYAQWGNLILGFSFILLGFMQTEKRYLFVSFGVVIAAIALYRFFHPYRKQDS